MIVTKGTQLLVHHRRKGTFRAEAAEDFDTDELFPKVIARQTVYGMVNEWHDGDLIECRKDLCKIEILKG